MGTVVQVLLRLQAIYIALQLLLLLLLLPLQLLHASPCHTTVEEFSVATTSDAEELSEALLCDGPGTFAVSWHGNIILSRTLSVSNGSTLNVTGSSDSTDGDSGAVIFGDGTVRLFEVDLGSTVSLTGLTFSGGDSAVRVNGESFVEVIDCSFMDNNRTSSDLGGTVYVGGSSSVVLKGETVLANNTAEYVGAIYLDDSSELNVTEGGSASFINNHAGASGGAIRVKDYSVFNSYGIASFVSNEAESGGAICIDNNSSIVLKGETVFANNSAEHGGAMYVDDSSELNVTEGGSASFSNNHADNNGGAVRVNDNSVFNSYGNASFVSNEAEFGGAINFDGSKGNFVAKVSFEGNHVNASGGAVYADSDSNLFFGGEVVFANNTADFGGAINIDDSELNLIGDVSFEGNRANSKGGAVYADKESNVSFGGEIFLAYNSRTKWRQDILG